MKKKFIYLFIGLGIFLIPHSSHAMIYVDQNIPTSTQSQDSWLTICNDSNPAGDFTKSCPIIANAPSGLYYFGLRIASGTVYNVGGSWATGDTIWVQSSTAPLGYQQINLNATTTYQVTTPQWVVWQISTSASFTIGQYLTGNGKIVFNDGTLGPHPNIDIYASTDTGSNNGPDVYITRMSDTLSDFFSPSNPTIDFNYPNNPSVPDFSAFGITLNNFPITTLSSSSNYFVLVNYGRTSSTDQFSDNLTISPICNPTCSINGKYLVPKSTSFYNLLGQDPNRSNFFAIANVFLGPQYIGQGSLAQTTTFFGIIGTSTEFTYLYQTGSGSSSTIQFSHSSSSLSIPTQIQNYEQTCSVPSSSIFTNPVDNTAYAICSSFAALFVPVPGTSINFAAFQNAFPFRTAFKLFNAVESAASTTSSDQSLNLTIPNMHVVGMVTSTIDLIPPTNSSTSPINSDTQTYLYQFEDFFMWAMVGTFIILIIFHKAHK